MTISFNQKMEVNRVYFFDPPEEFKSYTISRQNVNQITYILNQMIEEHRSAIEAAAIPGAWVDKNCSMQEKIVAHAMEWKKLNALLSILK